MHSSPSPASFARTQILVGETDAASWTGYFGADRDILGRNSDVYVVSMSEWRGLESNVVREVLLAIEVLSPSSSRHDRVKKRVKYQRHVPEYWIVDLDARIVERWRPNDERPEILSDTIAWAPNDATELLELDLVRFFGRVLDDAGR